MPRKTNLITIIREVRVEPKTTDQRALDSILVQSTIDNKLYLTSPHFNGSPMIEMEVLNQMGLIPGAWLSGGKKILCYGPYYKEFFGGCKTVNWSIVDLSNYGVQIIPIEYDKGSFDLSKDGTKLVRSAQLGDSTPAYRSQYRISFLDLAGSETKQIALTANSTPVRISPDGSKILYVSEKYEEVQTDSPQIQGAPNLDRIGPYLTVYWSAAELDSKIAKFSPGSTYTWISNDEFVLQEGRYLKRINVWKPNEARTIAEGELTHITPSPDGQWIAYFNRSEGNRLEVMRPDGSDVRAVGPRNQIRLRESLSWAPDSHRIAYSITDDIAKHPHPLHLDVAPKSDYCSIIRVTDINGNDQLLTAYAESPLWRPVIK